MKLSNVRIGFRDRAEFMFGQQMDLRVGDLLFDAAEHRGGEYDIAYRRKADDEEPHLK
jgi:hypothetical protein